MIKHYHSYCDGWNLNLNPNMQSHIVSRWKHRPLAVVSCLIFLFILFAFFAQHCNQLMSSRWVGPSLLPGTRPCSCYKWGHVVTSLSLRSHLPQHAFCVTWLWVGGFKYECERGPTCLCDPITRSRPESISVRPATNRNEGAPNQLRPCSSIQTGCTWGQISAWTQAQGKTDMTDMTDTAPPCGNDVGQAERSLARDMLKTPGVRNTHSWATNVSWTFSTDQTPKNKNDNLIMRKKVGGDLIYG